MSDLVFLIDESDEEEAIKPGTKEEQELEGSPALPEEEAQGLLCEICSFLHSHFFHSSPTTPYSIFLYKTIFLSPFFL